MHKDLICPNCGQEYDTGETHCHYCGGALLPFEKVREVRNPGVLFLQCPNCGRGYNSTTLYYCLNCNIRLLPAQKVKEKDVKHPVRHKVIGETQDAVNARLREPKIKWPDIFFFWPFE